MDGEKIWSGGDTDVVEGKLFSMLSLYGVNGDDRAGE